MKTSLKANPSGTVYLCDSLAKEMQRFNELALRLDHRLPQTAPESFEKFLLLPLENQQGIHAMVQLATRLLAEQLQSSAGDNPLAPLSKLENEKIRLRRAIEELGLKIVDPTFFDLIDDGDVIEIYSSENRQIYRNLLFCKLSSYSLVDVAVHTWQELYERPLICVEQIQSCARQQFDPRIGALTMAYNMQEHILREKLLYTKRKRTLLMDMKYLSPLENARSGQRTAAVSTCRVRVIAEEREDGSFIII